MKSKNWTLILAALCMAAPSMALAADEAAVALGLDLTYAESYRWRGMPLNEEPVLQPSLTLAGGGFSINVWANLDLTDFGEKAGYGDERGNATEVDYTASYERAFGPLTVALGFANYTFPHQGLAPATEAFIGAALDLPLSPSVTIYLDQTAEGANYTSIDFGHDFELWEQGEIGVGLAFAAHVGYANDKFVRIYYDESDRAAWHDWSAGVSLPISLGYGFSITPSYLYSALWDRDLRDEVKKGWDRKAEAGIFLISLAWSGEF